MALFTMMLFVLMPLLGLSESLIDELELAKQQVADLQIKAYKEYPELHMLEKMEQDAGKLYEEDKYRLNHRKTNAYLSQIKDDKDAASLYNKMKYAYRSIEDEKNTSENFKNNSLRPSIIALWRMYYVERMGDEKVAAMSEEELVAFVFSGLKADADRGQANLQKARDGHQWPGYVEEHSHLWAKAETRQGAARALVSFRTPKYLTDARQKLESLKIQFQNVIGVDKSISERISQDTADQVIRSGKLSDRGDSEDANTPKNAKPIIVESSNAKKTDSVADKSQPTQSHRMLYTAITLIVVIVIVFCIVRRKKD
jgi:hypothetical protein